MRSQVHLHNFLFLAGLVLSYPSWSQRGGIQLPEQLKEISGLASPDNKQLWALNDGGNTAELFRIDPKSGKILERCAPGVPNRDWEELCVDSFGRFWIADTGNNLNNRKNLRFYCFDPITRQVDSLLFHYPDQLAYPPKKEEDWNFDTEAVVWHNNRLHLFTKSRFKGRHYTKHYQLTAVPGTQVAELVDSLQIPRRAVTAAALSPDGQELVLIAYFFQKKPWLYTRATLYHFSSFQGTRFLGGKIKKKRLPKGLFARQFESVVHFQGGWWVANERLMWQAPKLWKLKFKP